MSNIDLILIAARAMLSEAYESREQARNDSSPLYPVWEGRFLQSQKFVSYIENVIEQESKGHVTLAEALVMIQGER